VDRRLPRDHRRNELTPQQATDLADLSFQDEAQTAVDLVAATFDGWGPTIHKQVRSGSPAQEIVRAAEDLDADLISMAAGSRGLTPTILLGSTASRVQHSAPCPVLICRPTARSERATG
jgi:nucleotide-binding universal stress UspA family protein